MANVAARIRQCGARQVLVHGRGCRRQARLRSRPRCQQEFAAQQALLSRTLPHGKRCCPSGAANLQTLLRRRRGCKAGSGTAWEQQALSLRGTAQRKLLHRKHCNAHQAFLCAARALVRQALPPASKVVRHALLQSRQCYRIEDVAKRQAPLPSRYCWMLEALLHRALLRGNRGGTA